jgi:3-hydroxyacyl-CoA dehydrogenase
MLAACQAQADQLVLEGVPAWEINRVMGEFGFPMGIFSIGDLGGYGRMTRPQITTRHANSSDSSFKLSDKDMLKRLIYPVINEGANILEESIALRSSDIDLIWVTGFNWPSYRGGPLHYADAIGLKTILEDLGHIADVTPSVLLRKLVEQGQNFSSL